MILFLKRNKREYTNYNDVSTVRIELILTFKHFLNTAKIARKAQKFTVPHKSGLTIIIHINPTEEDTSLWGFHKSYRHHSTEYRHLPTSSATEHAHRVFQKNIVNSSTKQKKSGEDRLGGGGGKQTVNQ